MNTLNIKVGEEGDSGIFTGQVIETAVVEEVGDRGTIVSFMEGNTEYVALATNGVDGWTASSVRPISPRWPTMRKAIDSLLN